MPLAPEDLEAVWSELADSIDAIPPERRELFLCKLALALASALDDPQRARDAFALARRSLEAPR
jgi:hypothetical protein